MKKNVLFVVADQLRADALGGALASCVDTPNLDRLAAESVVFDNHFTVTNPCGPARASLLTGLYAMNHRVIRNGAPLAQHHTNVAREARKLGYEPLLFGYTDSQPDPEQRHPNDPDLGIYESLMPGFREVVEIRMESGSQWPAYLRAQGYDVPLPLPERYLDLFRPQGGKHGNPTFYQAEHSDTAFLTSEAIHHLAVRSSSPWFAHVTYFRPHPPFVAPAPYHELIDPNALPATIGRSSEHRFFDAWFSEPSNTGLFHGFDGDCAGLEEKKVRYCRATYLALLAELDLHLGRILKWLEESGQADETLLIVTADHGDMLGDHGLWGKKAVFDPAFAIPLMIRCPGAKPRQVAALTESIDIVPTVLDWLGGDIPRALDGRSLRPWLEGEAPKDWKDAVMLEFELGDPSSPTRFERYFGLASDRGGVAILREERWKYVHFNGGIEPMLFDLEADPCESRDLADDPAHLRQLCRMSRKLLDRRMERADRRMDG